MVSRECIVFSSGGHFRPAVDLALGDGATAHLCVILFILLDFVGGIPRRFLLEHVIIID